MRGILGCRICRVRTCLSAAGLHIGHAKSNRMEEILVKYCALFGVQGATVRNRSYKVKPPVHHLFQVWLVCVHRVDHLQRVGPKRGWHSNVLEIFFFNKTKKSHEFPKFYFVKKLYIFREFPLPIIRSFLLHIDIGIFLAVLMTASKQGQDDPAWKLSSNLQEIYQCRCAVENSWWWAKEIPEICRVFWQNKIWEIRVFSWFY